MKSFLQSTVYGVGLLMCAAVANPALALPTASDDSIEFGVGEYTPPPYNRTYLMAIVHVVCTITKDDAVAQDVSMNNSMAIMDYPNPGVNPIWNQDKVKTIQPGTSGIKTFEFGACHIYRGADYNSMYRLDGIDQANVVFGGAGHTYFQ